jgi:integrating conjugative element protein (TIGR03761 family)
MPHDERHLQLNIGVLRADMELTLHTQEASRIWHGRRPGEEMHGIPGLNTFVGIMGTMKRGVEQDDPFSDWWMLRIEAKIARAKKKLLELRDRVKAQLASVPPMLSMGENLSIHPVTLPLYIGSPHGFMAVYLLTDFDEIARNVKLAHHIAQIDRQTKDRWLDEGAGELRSLFGLAQRYRYSGATREDCRMQNGVWLAAVEKFGAVPIEVITGELRSGYAPALRGARKQRSPHEDSVVVDSRAEGDDESCYELWRINADAVAEDDEDSFEARPMDESEPQT